MFAIITSALILNAIACAMNKKVQNSIIADAACVCPSVDSSVMDLSVVDLKGDLN